MRIFLTLLLPILFISCKKQVPNFEKWHKVELSFVGPQTSEEATENPFLNYKLTVTFSHADTSYEIPGFYAADGNAGETSASFGNVWKVRFTPDRVGLWQYRAELVKGDEVAIDRTVNAQPINLDDSSGEFQVVPSTATGADLKAKGRLVYDGTRYPKFIESNELYLKGGANSPENFLAYQDFDATYGYDTSQQHIKTYSPHITDWKTGDVTWKNGLGKGIIGSLNYLSSEGMNAVYFITMNIEGDGRDVWPYRDHKDFTRFDVSKLDQWDRVFSHAESLGIVLHIVLQETENERLLDDGNTGLQRSLYFRELVARFGYHNGILWNLGEENGPTSWSPIAQDDQQRRQMIDWFAAHDPYRHPVVLHTHSTVAERDLIIDPLIGYEGLSGLSVQIDNAYQVHDEFVRNLTRTTESGHTWMQGMDEIGWWWRGAMPDKDDPHQDTMRTQVLWASMMGGGYGVEWYFGYRYAENDLDGQDWRSRDHLWDLTRHALTFFRGIKDLDKYAPRDDLSTNAWCMTNNEHYILYSPSGESAQLKVVTDGKYKVKWFDPIKGAYLKEENISSKNLRIDLIHPEEIARDWACILLKS